METGHRGRGRSRGRGGRGGRGGLRGDEVDKFLMGELLAGEDSRMYNYSVYTWDNTS